MKLFGLVLSVVLSNVALAQTAVDPATRFPGYAPTVLENDAQVSSVFSTLDTKFKDFNLFLLQFGTQCTQRAETWSYDLAQTQHINSQKVFVFYTHAFKKWYYEQNGKNFKWWFHVAPYVLTKTDSGSLEERVLDHTFSDRPLDMKSWTDLFIESKQQCIENVPFANFEGDVSSGGASFDKNAHCYIVRAPMFDMYPMDIDARERGQRPQLDWDMGEVYTGSRALQAGARRDFLRRVGLE